MTIKQAIKIVESHNRWRRDNDNILTMGDVKEVGEALDVLLIVAKDYLTIYDMDKVKIIPKTEKR